MIFPAHARRRCGCFSNNFWILPVMVWVMFTGIHLAGAPIQHSPSEVLLVMNSNSPISQAVGAYYQQQRSITNVVNVQCVDAAISGNNESISVDTYTTQIATPISAYLLAHPGINFIVLTKGIPIRISGGITGEVQAAHPPQAALDTYLAAIDYPKLRGARKGSMMQTLAEGGASGVAWINRYYNVNAPFSHAIYGGYLVTRLDGYTQADAMAVVDRALTAEAGITSGPILIDVEPDFGIDNPILTPPSRVALRLRDDIPQSTWNADMVHAGNMLQAAGVPSNMDITPTFIGNQVNLLGYYSFAYDDDHFDNSAYQSLQFAPGAIGVTGVSTSARTFLPVNDGGQSLITDLIAHGITGVEGYINEPLWYSNTSPTINLQRYLGGYTLAESFYAADKYLGWETIIVGDPLCCPYFNQQTILQTPTRASAHGLATRTVKTLTCAEGGTYVSTPGAGSFLSYRRIALTGKRSFSARVASTSAQAQTLEIHLNSPSGVQLGTCVIPPTGDAQAWTTVTCSLSSVTAIATIYLVAPASGFNIEWFSFNTNPLTKQLVPGATVSLESMTNGAFLSALNPSLTADHTTVATTEQYQIVDAGNGNIALLSVANGTYVTADLAGVNPLTTSGNTVGTAQTFTEVDLGQKCIALLSVANGLYVSVETDNSSQAYNQGLSVSPDETFSVTTY